jgi:hypothetical protein
MFHWLVIIAVFLVAAEIKIADCLDKLRRHLTHRFLFRMRRTAMFLNLLSLCWAAGYSYSLGWDPWPPFIAFLLAYDAYVGAQILVMRDDLARFGQLDMITGGETIAGD